MPGKLAVKSPRDVYLVGPLTDVLVAGSAVSLLLYGAFLAFPDVDPLAAGHFAYLLSFAINFPHFAATSWRLYQSWDRMIQFPKTAFLSPVVVGLTAAWAIHDPGWAPWWIKLVVIWQGYHFSGQTKGIALLYARRLGFDVDTTSRRLLTLAVYGSWAGSVIQAETLENLGAYFTVRVPHLYHLAKYPWASVGALLSILAAAAFLGLIARGVSRQGRWMPLAAATPLAVHLFWFALGAQHPAFQFFIPGLHSLQYLLIAWVFQLKEQSARAGFVAAPRTVLWETVKWAVVIGLGGAFLFRWLPDLLTRDLQLANAEACVVAAVNVHHFFVDGVIWKLRDPRTRSMLGGNLLDLAGVPRAV